MMKKKSKSHRFMRLAGNAGRISSYGGSRVLLYSFRNISTHSFSFPFSGMSKVREALRIQFRPLLGDAVSNISIIPLFVNVGKKLSSGCVFLLLGDETNAIEETMSGVGGDYSVWPAPMAFAAEVGGNGLVIWSDEEFIATLWLKDWTPMFYKAVDKNKSSVDDEKLTALEYIEQSGERVEQILLLDSEDITDDDIQACGAKTLSLCSAYEQLDLSSKGTNLLERRERLVGIMSRAAKTAVVSGFIFLLAVCGIYAYHSSLLSSGATNAESVYEASFGERSRQPLSSAQSKLRSVSTSETDNSLQAILRDVTDVWDKLGASADITIETLSYGSETTSILGTAKSNESIQRLRNLLEEQGYSPRTENIQTIPGGDMRFNMNITRGGANI
ncbi:MAG: hypothetical protein LBQ58_02870 [Synergistaceae bacterium]|jgi:hypothetical protein|nr:hypothetical protein [Synergistaceae bacterium]